MQMESTTKGETRKDVISYKQTRHTPVSSKTMVQPFSYLLYIQYKAAFQQSWKVKSSADFYC